MQVATAAVICGVYCSYHIQFCSHTLFCSSQDTATYLAVQDVMYCSALGVHDTHLANFH